MRRELALCAILALGTATAFAGDNPRVYISESSSWEISGGAAGTDGSVGASGGGGARPQTAEIIKTFNQRCPNLVITSKREKADYVVLLDHEGGKGFSRDNKIVVFNNSSGDAIFSRSTRVLGNAVKDACPVIYHDFSRRSAAADSNKQVEATLKDAASTDQTMVAGDAAGKVASVHIASTPAGADITIDGKFMGSTPSTLQLAPGMHNIAVEKSGYSGWQKNLHVTAGDVNIVAELTQAR